MTFQMYLRGRLVEITGSVEGPDRSVGIFGSYFCPESIKSVEPGVSMDFVAEEDCKDETELWCLNFTDQDWNLIDEAFWASQPFDPFSNTVQFWMEAEDDC